MSEESKGTKRDNQSTQRLKMVLGFATTALIIASVVLLRALGKPFDDTVEIGMLGSAVGTGILGAHGALKMQPGGGQ